MILCSVIIICPRQSARALCFVNQESDVDGEDTGKIADTHRIGEV